MAETPKTDMSADDVRKEMEKQIAELKGEVSRLTSSLKERGQELYEDVRDDAEGYYHDASKRAKRAARQVRDQASAVSDTIRENPGTAATLLSSAGLLGLLIGLVIGQSMSSSNHSRRWY